MIHVKTSSSLTGSESLVGSGVVVVDSGVVDVGNSVGFAHVVGAEWFDGFVSGVGQSEVENLVDWVGLLVSLHS